jgi:hypothetical protein
MNKWYQEIRRGYLAAIGAALFAWTLAAIPTIPRLVLGLSLTDMQVVYIRAGLALFGFAVFALVGWVLFFQTRRKLHEALKKPHRFQDDFTFDSRLGVYYRKGQEGYFCASCTPKEILSPLKEDKDGWRCQIRECCKYHPNPDYKPPPRVRERIPGHLSPEDF